ncbi:hypothetical protein ACTFIV_007873 [Dictyostelium citrinum]
MNLLPQITPPPTVAITNSMKGNNQEFSNVSRARKKDIVQETVQIKLNNLNVKNGEQKPESFAILVCINEMWIHALIDTGCNTNLIHPRLIHKEMEMSNCNVRVKTPVDHQDHFANKRVTTAIGFNVASGTAITKINSLQYQWSMI